MELPQGNFFQVTINSNKLINLIQSFKLQITNAQTKLHSFQKLIQDLRLAMQIQKKRNDEQRHGQLQKLKRMVFEESHYNKLYIRDMDKKMGQKFQQNQHMFTLFDSRINFIKNNLQHDMALKDTFFSDRLVKQREKAIETMDQKIAENNSKTKDVFDRMQINHEELEYRFEQLLEKLNSEQTYEDCKSQQLPVSMISLEKSRSKRTIKEKRHGTLFANSAQFNSIKQKIQTLELRTAKSNSKRNILKNKSVKINEYTNTSHAVSQNPDLQQKNADKLQEKRIQFQKQILTKIQLIQNYIYKKSQEFETGISKINNKSQVFKEQIGIILRRIEKNKDMSMQLKEALKNREEVNIDHKLLEKMKNGIAKLSKQLQEVIETKMSYESYDKEKSKMNYKIENLNQALGQKAQKCDVKKGFVFLQEKMKEIIVVLVQDKANNRDSATKKLPFKCLSCDKNLDFTANELTPNYNNYASNNNSRVERHSVNPMNSVRSAANLIRKRKRTAYNSVVNDQNYQ